MQKETQLKTGDSIETGPDSNVSLRFVDGTRLLLAPNSRITLSEMILFGKIGMAQTLLELHRGQVETHAAKWVDLPDDTYQLRVRAINADGLEGVPSPTPHPAQDTMQYSA